jgi:hypothetical protein
MNRIFAARTSLPAVITGPHRWVESSPWRARGPGPMARLCVGAACFAAASTATASMLSMQFTGVDFLYDGTVGVLRDAGGSAGSDALDDLNFRVSSDGLNFTVVPTPSVSGGSVDFSLLVSGLPANGVSSIAGGSYFNLAWGGGQLLVDVTGGSVARATNCLNSVLPSCSGGSVIITLFGQSVQLQDGGNQDLPLEINALGIADGNFAPVVLTFSGNYFGPPGALASGSFTANGSGEIQGTVAPVPLPGAAWLLLSGLGWLGVAARRRRGVRTA